MAQSIVAGIVEIERIIADLLEYARDTRLDLGEYPLDRVLAPVIDAVQAPDERRVRIEAHGLDAGIMAMVDGPRLRQVFTNVLKNAVEASESVMNPCVDVRLGLRNDAAVVEIVDNGPGMTAEQRSKVFRPFFTTKSTGTGLGMPIVKKIMDLHGGEIEIDSTPGRGTAVRLIIPRLASPAPAAAGTGGGS